MVEIKFNRMFGPGVEKTGLDLSRQTEEVFTEIPPFAMDADGNFLNKSSEPILKKTGEVNVFEKIQSYRDEVDIYKIIERMAISGDTLPELKHDGLVYDYSNIPDNIHDFDSYVGECVANLKKASPELASVVLRSDSTEADVRNAIDSYVAKVKAVNDKKVEGYVAKVKAVNDKKVEVEK